jgi:hypothetical protein
MLEPGRSKPAGPVQVLAVTLTGSPTSPQPRSGTGTGCFAVSNAAGQTHGPVDRQDLGACLLDQLEVNEALGDT